MRALSIKQPYAEAIAAGRKKIEFRSKAIKPGPLLVVASLTPGKGYAGEPRGVAICVIEISKVSGDAGDFKMHLANPVRVEPEPIKGFAAIYHIADERIRPVGGGKIASIAKAAEPTKSAPKGAAKSAPGAPKEAATKKSYRYRFRLVKAGRWVPGGTNGAAQAKEMSLELAESYGTVEVHRDGELLRLVDRE